MNYLVGFLMTKDENRYLKEWIAFHRTQGIEKFYIYDNESAVPAAETLKREIDAGLVEVKFWKDDGKGKHHRAMDDYLRRTDVKTVWTTMTDTDEFIYGDEERLVDYLKRRESENTPAFKFLWKGFGHGGHDKKPEGLVIEHFLLRGNYDDWPLMGGPHPIGKSVVRFGVVKGMGDVHTAGGVQTDLVTKEVFINHYVTRSKEEFVEKSRRGAGNGEKRGLHLFNIFNKDLNKYEDRSVLKWLGKTKNKMQEML